MTDDLNALADEREAHQAAAVSAMIAVVERGASFTFFTMHCAGSLAYEKAGGSGANSDWAYRAADRMIQRLRKAGVIAQVKRGLWQKVPARAQQEGQR